MSQSTKIYLYKLSKFLVGATLLSILLLYWNTPTASAQQATRIRDDLRSRATWQLPQESEVRKKTFAWLKKSKASKEIIAKANAVWPKDSQSVKQIDLLGKFTEVLALNDDRVKQLVEFCSQPAKSEKQPTTTWLNETKESSILRNNMKLYVARWQVQNNFADEGLELTKNLKPTDVVDPAALLFYRSIAHHRLLNVTEAVADLEVLLEHQQDLPRRYASLSKLLLADIKTVKTDSLDHIARRMDDIRRRLELGRANERVIKIEDGVIKSLDKMIKEMEKKRQQQQQATHNRGGGGTPPNESRIVRGKGDGKVEKKDIGRTSGWGKLTPKERERSLQRVSQEFPSHYREIIEEYFRSMAADEKRSNNDGGPKKPAPQK